MTQGVVYIAGLSHSGSTLLNLLLGAHPKLIGLGEVDSVLQIPAEEIYREMGMLCSCGKPVRSCVFWGPTLAALEASSKTSLAEKYTVVFDSFNKIFGADFQIVDSSKYLAQLNNVLSLPGVEVRVIHLVKDVRSYVVSQRDIVEADFKYKRLPVLLGLRSFSAWFYRNTTKSPIYLFQKWYRDNRGIQNRLAKSGLQTMRLGYDELAQFPQLLLPRIYSFLRLENITSSSIAPKETNSHVFMGNQMLGDPAKMERVHYDDRWRQRSDWRLAAKLFPAIMAYNEDMVYSARS